MTRPPSDPGEPPSRRLARMAPRSGGVRITTWWARAWLRAVEESAFATADVTAGKALARRGLVGGLTLEPGRWYAAVEDPRQSAAATHTASVELPVLAADRQQLFRELVRSRAGRWAGLATGKLDHDLAEEAEESGVELVPYGGEFTASCTCEPWADPCRHALALMFQLGWTLETDARVLLWVRGITGDLLGDADMQHPDEPAAAGAAGAPGSAGPDPVTADLRTAYAAIQAARRLLAESE